MIPVIKIEVESMKQTIQHAFSERMLDLSEEVKLALDSACTKENIQSIVDETTSKVVKESVANAIRAWWVVSDEGRKLIDEEVAMRLNEEAALYRKSR